MVLRAESKRSSYRRKSRLQSGLKKPKGSLFCRVLLELFCSQQRCVYDTPTVLGAAHDASRNKSVLGFLHA
jgi:hypothetical protein